MFQVKAMNASDFSFATKLANTMNWNMAPEDFEFSLILEPQGCFVLLDGSERIGIATCVSFGKVGWFGNLIIKEKCRKKGAGSLLVKRSVDYLQTRGVKTIGLYAYPNLLEFYSSQGFKVDENFSVLSVETLQSIDAETLAQPTASAFQSIIKFDSTCFGGDRKKLLKSIIYEEGNLCHYVSESGKVVGYIASTVYKKMAWVGPMVCQESKVEVASLLLKSVLSKLRGKNVYLALPKKEFAFMDILFNVGFKEDFSVVRMFLGANTARNCIYLAESLERG
ncbi:MAG TPA: GNAT family N-acetyltransferase [Candidatus Acidoferrum sp.]|nr:GNAT family N-acetyltransferase [Candidatus Acidoferrum sp.]